MGLGKTVQTIAFLDKLRELSSAGEPLWKSDRKTEQKKQKRKERKTNRKLENEERTERKKREGEEKTTTR